MDGLKFICFLMFLKFCAAGDCESKETCDQCIEEFNCFWCTSVEKDTSHCLPITEQSSCDQANTENPQNSTTIIKEEPLTETEQISPQKVKLRLRRNQKYEINFQYKQSANYPVDLYYLMDLSHSMEKSKNKIAELGGKLANEMKRKTTNFQIGFGTFVDKRTLPFVNTHPYAIKHPCEGCAPPYSFINQQPLINDAALFSKKVRQTKMSGNLDTPEGGLDAIMQAIVCKKEIGWRENARHLLVMSTDAVSHIAGDGKLGGVIEPNDATCHLINNTYTDEHALVYDYPSVSQINYVARENNINIIFASVLKDKQDPEHLITHYGAMSNAIENSKTGVLDNDSDNVVQLISDIYDEIRDSVKITSIPQKDVNVNITSNCPGFIDGTCNQIKPGQTINFTATIEPVACHKDAKNNKKTIKIKPEGLQDSLTIELEILCECTCAANKIKAHEDCNFKGDLECGICRCNDGQFGSQCQCDRAQSKSDDISLCIKPHGGKNESCSGQGKCLCGKCECKTRPDESEVISGKYCECDNFSCPLKCSGADHGKCECGKCNCHQGWSGDACDCSTDETACLMPGSKELCSGHGKCKCGKCDCVSDSKEQYSGQYCAECTSCPPQRCDEFKRCVECQAYETGNSTSNCTEICPLFQTQLVEKLDNTNPAAKKCYIYQKDCKYVFEYSYDEDQKLIVKAEKEKTCPEPPPLLPIILGVIGSVLLVGIITLIVWKIVTTMHDKKEYARFMDERNKTKWATDSNPLYKPGTSHFQNPAYNRVSQRFSVALAAKKAEMEDNKGRETQN